MNGAQWKRAWAVLFGSDTGSTASRDLPIDPLLVRQAYRRRALATHPDRAAVLGIPEPLLRHRFEEVAWAYRELSSALKAAPRSAPPRHAPPASTRSAGVAAGLYHRGAVPPRTLLFGEFVYFSGLVSWQDLVAAIAWQRRQRPLIGTLAVELGMLDPPEIRLLLELRRATGRGCVRFAEFARSEGVLTSFERLALVGSQRRMQRPLGQYFVTRDILAASEVEGAALRLRHHNWRHGASPRRRRDD